MTWNKQYSWIGMLTVTLLLIGIILSSQSNSMEEYIATLESQKEPDLLALWHSNDQRLASLQGEYYLMQAEYDDMQSQTSQGKVSIGTILTEIDSIHVFNGDVETEGPGVEIVFTGEIPLVANEILDVVNELYNSGAEAVSINGKRLTSRTHLNQIATDFGYDIRLDKMLISYPLTIQAIGDSHGLYTGLTIIGGIVDKLNSYSIFPTISSRDNIVIDASMDKDNYPAYQPTSE
ncbi:DUF881 domain-containing protein [Clostridia bacterium]|nr:DUF881 domain-containing protein [Clostridia bacterium]